VKKQAQKRITPTEALHILMGGGLSAHAAAARLDQAVKTNECRLWHHHADEAAPDYFDEPVPPDYAAQMLTIVAHVEADGRWQGQVVGVPYKHPWIFEFDADEVRALLSRAKLPGPQPTPERRKPGRKITGNWRLVAAHKMHTIREEELRTPTAKELCEHCAVMCGYTPDDSEMRDLMRFLINE